jgi:hypothetical protein
MRGPVSNVCLISGERVDAAAVAGTGVLRHGRPTNSAHNFPESLRGILQCCLAVREEWLSAVTATALRFSRRRNR